ncbi:MAG TPA: ATP-binding protein [Thermoguttaceae bacterium]|nr:ATP-binding protein [Thermoguttaceae bacterium]
MNEPMLFDDVPESADAAARRRLALAFCRRRGERFRNCRIHNFAAGDEQQRVVVERLTGYLARAEENVRAGRGLVFFGGCGTGKTHLLIAAAGQLIAAHGFSVEFITGPEFAAAMRRAIHGDEEEVLMPLARADIAILDDLSPPIGRVTEYQSAALFRLVDRRYRASKPTWVSMNVGDKQEAVDRVSAPVIDRLTDGALCMFFPWESYRRPQE